MSQLAVALTLFFCLFRVALAQVAIERQEGEIFIQLPKMLVNSERSGHSRVFVPGLNNSVIAKAPSLPQLSFILEGTPKRLKVKVEVLETETREGVLPTPGWDSQLREGAFKPTLVMAEDLYEKEIPDVEMTYLGKFRKKSLTRVKINVAKYNGKDKTVSVARQFKITHNSREFRFRTKKFYKYLIIAPVGYAGALESFVAWKEREGFAVEVEEVHPSLISTETIKEIVADHYKTRKVHFVMLVGTEKLIPTHYLKTRFSYRTPSDFPYFAFDGKEDIIPDVFYSRIVVEKPEQLRPILWKTIEYELGLHTDHSGFQSIAGVASNEGRNPSDDEYIRGIGSMFKGHHGALYTHFGENDIKSNRYKFNQALNRGVAYLTYMGHGTGKTWPSFHESYKTGDIDRLKNQQVVKPVVIDVACQNGKISGTNFIGSKLMAAVDDAGNPLGAVAYYGGTVNISWHPPAIMAKGIVAEYIDHGVSRRFLGEALLAGQLYLAKNWDRRKDIVDNARWFHLQGDPGLRIRYDQRR
ncbi:MAG: C25 family cysteine peptidase [Bacteriovoracales bacterium]|nr:C25 family cysteine peptidase [Bacteriovoracales bacterium]